MKTQPALDYSKSLATQGGEQTKEKNRKPQNFFYIGKEMPIRKVNVSG